MLNGQDVMAAENAIADNDNTMRCSVGCDSERRNTVSLIYLARSILGARL